MSFNVQGFRRLFLGLAACACGVGTAPAAVAQTTTVTYVLEDVWLLPSVTHPNAAARPLTGSFDWTYTPGDFENGSGTLLGASIPWWGSGISNLDANIDVDSVEITFPGNVHGMGLDVTLRFLEPLTPSQASVLDVTRSHFDIEVGISHKGDVISGRGIPVSPFHSYCFGDGTGAACPCANAGEPFVGCANSTGAGGRLAAAGSAQVTADDLTLCATGLPDGAASLLISGTARANGGLGVQLTDGLLCVGGNILRMELDIADSGGAASFGPGLAAQGGALAGQTRHFQCWHRDASLSPCMSGANLTNAVSVLFAP